MGDRSRRRRARREGLLPLLMPPLRALAARVERARPREAWRLGLRLGEVMRWLAPGREVIRRNLTIATGRPPSADELLAFEARYFRHLGLLLVEFARQPTITRDNLAEHFDLAGLDRARAVFDEGRGVIFVAGHAGLWELAGHAAALRGIKLLSVAKMSGHAAVDELVLRLRQAGGQRVIDARGSMWAMKKALDRGEAVGINVDQEARQGLAFAPFFGVMASTSTTPAQLHLRTKAPIVVATAHRLGLFRYAIEVYDVIRWAPTGDREADLTAITARVNRAMEAPIRARPEQWLWSHRRWRRRPVEEHHLPEARWYRRVEGGSPPLELSGAPNAVR